MYNDSTEVAIYLVCFTAPFLLIAVALLAGGYYAHRWAGAQANRTPVTEPVPVEDLSGGRIPVPPVSAAWTPKVESSAVKPAGNITSVEARPSLRTTASPSATPLEAKIEAYRSEGNVQGLIEILKSPETNDKAAELTIEALSTLGLPAMEALCDALGDRSRLTRILSLQEQGANVGPLLRTAISSAAKFYRLKR
jgi:hypothetical protein